MELQKRDRSLARTAKDVERKYNLGRVSEIDRELKGKAETIMELEKKNEELIEKYGLLEEKVMKQIEEMNVLEASLANYYRKEEVDEKFGDIEGLLSEI